ncbi:ABC transporter ATP-binding protein [Giardia duodenalis]|uniref:ABC transporter ATP-binding protein n=1 Tax=Giardia intestinalis TaxID=5741 RepID=V6TKT1_GIAIN|nr:ABC transporter ATP-binding protein [Giardia intestinalis]
MARLLCGSRRFRAHFVASLRLALSLRLKFIVGMVINITLGLVFPLLMTISISSTAPKEKLSFDDIHLDSPCLKVGTCYTFAWGPTGNKDVEAFMSAVFEEARTAISRNDVKDIGFQTFEELYGFITGEGLGHVGVGLFIENSTRKIRLYCNNKVPNVPLMADISLDSSTLLQVVRILNTVHSGISGYDIQFYNTMSLFFQSIGATSISIVSMTFIVSGMYTLSNIGMMKGNRRYEYLVCHGLHRLAYQIANAVVTLGEIAIVLVGTILICYYFGIGSTSNRWLTVVVLLLSIFPVAAQNVSWSLFCASTISRPNTMQLLFFLPSMLVAIVQMIITFTVKQELQSTNNSGIQFLMAILSLLFPPFANSSYFTAASMVFARDSLYYSTFGRVTSITDGLTKSTKYYPNLLLLVLSSIISGLAYFALAVYQEYTSPGSAAPRKPRSFPIHWLQTRKTNTKKKTEDDKQSEEPSSINLSTSQLIESQIPLLNGPDRENVSEYAISLRDVSVIFPFKGRATKTENPPIGDVISAKYVSNGSLYTTARGYNVSAKDTKALYHLTLNLPYNSVIGLLGANGSGKSTLLKVLLGMYKPVSSRYLPNKYAEVANGSVCLLGTYCPVTAEEELYSGRHLALVLQENVMFPKATVGEQINIFAAIVLYDFPLEERNQLILTSLECMGLADKLNQKVETLSGGQKRRLNIAMAILLCEAGLAELLIMDEPACGVDIESRTFLWKYLKSLRIRAQQTDKRFCVLLTTHLFEEVEELCETVVMLRDGRLLAAGSQLFFKTEFAGGYQLLLDCPNSRKILFDVHRKFFYAHPISNDDCEDELLNVVTVDPYNHNLSALFISYADQAKLPDALQYLTERGIPQEQCALHTALLSEIFIQQQEKEMPEVPAVEHGWYCEK